MSSDPSSNQKPKSKIQNLLFLVGPRGSGKTTVAKLLADRLGWSWLDADDVIEQQAKCSIREIFYHGEPVFRSIEEQVLSELCSLKETVVATGGGAVLKQVNRDRMSRAGTVVWLTADVDTLWLRISDDSTTRERRPVLGVGGREEVAQIMSVREPLYRSVAHIQVDTRDKTPAQVAEEVLARLAGESRAG
jgi:shikimate kinase